MNFPYIISLVVPGISIINESFDLVNRLNNVDFPTLVFPKSDIVIVILYLLFFKF